MAHTIQHYPGCRPDYPEKPPHEPPQPIITMDIDDGEVVHQCGDCGAFVIMQQDARDANAVSCQNPRRNRNLTS